MDADRVRIEGLTTVESVREHVRLQELVWGHEHPEAVPAHLLLAAARNGGVVLGAYSGPTMIGLLFGVPALRDGRVIHLSHLLAVHPAWRGHGIGAAMKWRQRNIVLAQGIDLVTWTFDPLGASNAQLNLARLGGRSGCYVRDYYGPMQDQLNKGMPSDRLVVDWHLTAPEVEARAAGRFDHAHADELPIVLGAKRGDDSLPYPEQLALPSDANRVLVEIPRAHHELKQAEPALALAWRTATRAAFEELFAAGYVAVDVTNGGERIYYVLERTSYED